MLVDQEHVHGAVEKVPFMDFPARALPRHLVEFVHHVKQFVPALAPRP